MQTFRKLNKIRTKDIPYTSRKKYGNVPNVVIPITAGKTSIQLLEEAQKNGEFIGIVSQKNSDLEQPAEKDIYQIGTLAKIIKIIKLPEGNITAITKGFHRFKIKKIVEKQPYFKAEITKLKDGKAKIKKNTRHYWKM